MKTGHLRPASGRAGPETDPRTTDAAGDRLPDIRFFTPAEEATATALCDRLLGQDGEPTVAVVPRIDARLAEQQTDGLRYADMPQDGQAWRSSLRFLDEDSQDICARDFALASKDDQQAVIAAVRDLGPKDWHGLNAAHVWSLWTRYACAEADY